MTKQSPCSFSSGITKRQIEVLGLLGDGLSMKAAASALGVSTSAIEYHRAKLFERLKIRSFSELVKMAVAFHLTDL